MSHYIYRRDRKPLSPREIIRLLREEFAYVVASKKKGEAEVMHGLKYLLGLRRHGAPCPIGELNAMIREDRDRLKQAYLVRCADDRKSKSAYLEFVLTRDTKIFIGYSSAQHERDARPLLRRCAEAIGCVVGGHVSVEDDE
ncbi:MAG TPA: hypothetical protein VMP01_28585 [Pirellulaceae bacterium]|nr:hypothetical protein [Pirellulaceae bacterium]